MLMLGGLSLLLLPKSKTQRRISLITTQMTWPTTVMMASRISSTNRMKISSMRL